MYSNRNEFTLDKALSESLSSDSFQFNERNIRKLNEAQKIKLSDRIAGAMLSSVKKKLDNPDVKEIEKSKGDFTKYKDFSIINESASFLKRLSDMDVMATSDFKQAMNIITNAISFLLSEKSQFVKSFQRSNSLIMCTYDATIIGIVKSLGLVMSNCIKIDVSNYNYTFKAEPKYRKNVCDSKIVKSLESILKNYENKKINKVFDLEKGQIEGIVKNEDFKVGLFKDPPEGMDRPKRTLIASAIIFAIILILLYNCRTIVYIFYRTKLNIADDLEKTAEMVRLNTLTLDNSEKGNAIREKQLKYADKLEKYAAKFKLDYEVAEQKADREINEENKEMNSQEDSSTDDIIV